MTREEAKEFFEDPHVNYNSHSYYTEEEEIEANNWAITALDNYISIDDVMSVFDDFMCGEVDGDGMETFRKMLKDKIESE